MEIFITGDTHGDFRRFRPDIFYEQEHMTKEDLVLVCGDFGGIWHGDPRDDAGLDWLEDRPYTTTHGMMQDWTGWRTGHTLLHLCLGTTKTMTLTKTTPKKNGMVDRSRGYVPPFCTSCEVRYMSSMAGSFLPWAALPPMISRTASWNRTILTSRKSSSNSNSAVRCFV